MSLDMEKIKTSLLFNFHSSSEMFEPGREIKVVSKTKFAAATLFDVKL